MWPKCTHLPNHPITVSICHLCHHCTLIGVPTTKFWYKAQQLMQTLAPELESDWNTHIYSTIHSLLSFVLPVTLAPSLGFPPPISGTMVTGLTNHKYKWIVEWMWAFGSDFNSGASVYIICWALCQLLVVRTLIRVQRWQEWPITNISEWLIICRHSGQVLNQMQVFVLFVGPCAKNR